MRRTARAKPVHVVAEGYLCSAAYHVACQATTISASPSTVVGSIGTIIALIDDSEMFTAAGVKVIPITTGINKAAGYPGVPIVDEHVKMLSRLVEYQQATFEANVQRGRRLSPQQLAEVTDGSVWSAAIAKNKGLIDTVQLPEDRFAELEQKFPAEMYTNLRGYEAAAKFDELAVAAAKVEYPEDVPKTTLKRLCREYPTLAAAAAEYEAKR
jgi:ClpP class serine protease